MSPRHVGEGHPFGPGDPNIVDPQVIMSPFLSGVQERVFLSLKTCDTPPWGPRFERGCSRFSELPPPPPVAQRPVTVVKCQPDPGAQCTLGPRREPLTHQRLGRPWPIYISRNLGMRVRSDCKSVIPRRAEINAGNRAEFTDRTGLTRDPRFAVSVVRLDAAFTACWVVSLDPGTSVTRREAEMPRFLWHEVDEEVGERGVPDPKHHVQLPKPPSPQRQPPEDAEGSAVTRALSTTWGGGVLGP